MSTLLKNTSSGEGIRCSLRLKLKAQREVEAKKSIDGAISDVGRKDAIKKKTNVRSRLGSKSKVNSDKKSNEVSEALPKRKQKKDEGAVNKRPKNDGSIEKNLGDSVATIVNIDSDSGMGDSSAHTKSLDSRQDTNIEFNLPQVSSEHERHCTITVSTSAEESRHKVQMWVDDIGGPSELSSFNSTKDDTSMIVHFNDTINNRSILYEDQNSEYGSDVDESNDTISEVAPTPTKSEATCVVVDTNIFMHHLSVLRNVLKQDTPTQIVVLVPWMVLQELDFFKDNTHLKFIAREGLLLINKELQKKDPILFGQSVDDVSKQRDLGKGPDDKILACCLQQQEKYRKVILLSNDINLCNKAICNKLEVVRPYETNRLFNYSDSIRKIQDKMSVFLSEVIIFCCQETFGSKMKEMQTLQGMPWTFNGCLQRIMSHWNTVFRSFLLKQAKNVIDTLIDLTKGINKNECFKFREFETKNKELLIYIQDIPQFNCAAMKLNVELSH